MAEDEYERRKKMTEFQRVKETVGKNIKGLFGGGDKAKAAAPPAPAPPMPIPNQDLGKNIKDRRDQEQKVMKEYKKGGKVKKTGPAKLHKGERVLTAKQTQMMEKKPAVKKAIGLKTKKR